MVVTVSILHVHYHSYVYIYHCFLVPFQYMACLWLGIASGCLGVCLSVYQQKIWRYRNNFFGTFKHSGENPSKDIYSIRFRAVFLKATSG